MHYQPRASRACLQPLHGAGSLQKFRNMFSPGFVDHTIVSSSTVDMTPIFIYEADMEHLQLRYAHRCMLCMFWLDEKLHPENTKPLEQHFRTYFMITCVVAFMYRCRIQESIVQWCHIKLFSFSHTDIMIPYGI